MLPTLVSYHYPCPDGIFAALAAHLHFIEAGQRPVWVPNTVYSPRKIESLGLQVGQHQASVLHLEHEAIEHECLL